MRRFSFSTDSDVQPVPSTSFIANERHASYPSRDRQVVGSYEGEPNPAKRDYSGPQLQPSLYTLIVIQYS